jgi:hypothetical protein
MFGDTLNLAPGFELVSVPWPSQGHTIDRELGKAYADLTGCVFAF